MPIFKVENLEYARRDNVLFQGLDFQLSDGELLQVDGVNGSGKSSLIQLCAGLLQPSNGKVTWNAVEINSCRYEYHRAISYFGHKDGVKSSLTVTENMRVMHALSGIVSTPDYVDIFNQIGLRGVETHLLSRLSAGQKRRVGLTHLLMSTATLWLLDEPFNALDKNGKAIVERLIVTHCRNGGIVIFATHQTMEIDGYGLRHLHLDQHHV